MMRTLTPSLVSQSARARPVGPAPTIRTSLSIMSNSIADRCFRTVAPLAIGSTDAALRYAVLASRWFASVDRSVRKKDNTVARVRLPDAPQIVRGGLDLEDQGTQPKRSSPLCYSTTYTLRYCYAR